MVAYKSLTTKEKSSWVISKVVAVTFGSIKPLMKAFHYKVTVQMGFHKGGHNKSLLLTRLVAKTALTVI